MKNFYFLLISFVLSIAVSGQNYNNPVDVVYDEAENVYYVSNWADGDGFISIVNTFGEITGTLFSGLDYAGGMLMVDDILYVADNGDLYAQGVLPSYLVMVDMTTGQELDRVEISSELTYLNMLDTDNNGNIYISDSHTYRIYKYNMATQSVDTIIRTRFAPFGLCFDAMEDRLLYTESGPKGSLIMSMDMETNDTTALFWWPTYIEDLIMNEEGEYFFDSWDHFPNPPDGKDHVYKLNHIMDWTFELSANNDRPFGMCLGHDNMLAVSNFGGSSAGNTVRFIDLTPYGTGGLSAGQQELQVFPNPGNGRVQVKVPNGMAADGGIRVTDLKGRVVHESPLMQGREEVSLDLTELPAGMYVLVLRKGGMVYREKLVIQ